MPNTQRWFSLPVLFVVLSVTRVAAQEEVTVLPGEPLRLEIVGPSTAHVGERCSGRVRSVSLDTLIVAAAGQCSPGSYVADLHVIRGDRGSRTTHAGLGALAGGLVGALVARRSSSTDCGGQSCGSGYVNRGKMWAGLAAGGAAGGVVGFVLPSGPRWVRAGSPRPLRVAGVNVRPGIEVSLGGSPGG